MELFHVGQSVKINEDGHNKTYRKPVLGLLRYNLEILQGLLCVDVLY
jgi:hypothetical protein